MGMQLAERFRELLGLKNCGISKELRREGHEITTQAIDGWDQPKAGSIRFKTLVAIVELAAKRTGRTFEDVWAQTGTWVREEFGKGPIKSEKKQKKQKK